MTSLLPFHASTASRHYPIPTRQRVEELSLQAADYLQIIQNQRKVLAAFRVGCLSGRSLAEGHLTAKQWRMFCVYVGICPLVTQAHVAESIRLAESVHKPTVVVDHDEELDLMRMKRQLDHATAARKAAATSAQLPSWLDTDVTVPEAGSWSHQLSIGAGMHRRRLGNAKTVLNLMQGLQEDIAQPKGKTSFQLPVDYIDSLFVAVCQDSDHAMVSDFIVLLYEVGRRIQVAGPDEQEFDIVVAALLRDIVASYLKDCCPPTMSELLSLSPIRAFPGATELCDHFRAIFDATFRFLSGGSGICSAKDLHLFSEWIGASRAPHMNKSLGVIEMTMRLALGHGVTSPVPIDDAAMFDYEQFADWTFYVSYYLYSFEPHRSLLPTVAARTYVFVTTLWADWYKANIFRDILDDVVPEEPEPPTILSLSSTTLPANHFHTMEIVGKDFGSRGLYARFGSRTTMTARIKDGSSVRVEVPPINATTMQVRLRRAMDDVLVSLYFSDKVQVSVSRDGFTWGPPFASSVVFEDQSPEINLSAFMVKLQRVFMNYAQYKEPLNTQHMRRFQWLRLLQDFCVAEAVDQAVEKAVNAGQTATLRISGDPFELCSTVSILQSQSELNISEPDRRSHRILSFDGFLKALALVAVLTHAGVNEGLKAMLDTDRWLGRELLDDLPTADRGGLAVRIIRAANVVRVMRVVEHPQLHLNSPRFGAAQSTAAAPMWNAPSSTATPVTSPIREPTGFAATGTWLGDGTHESLKLDYATTGDDRDEKDDLALYASLTAMMRAEAQRRRVQDMGQDPNMLASSVAVPILPDGQLNRLDDEFVKADGQDGDERDQSDVLSFSSLARNVADDSSKNEHGKQNDKATKLQIIGRHMTSLVLHAQREELNALHRAKENAEIRGRITAMNRTPAAPETQVNNKPLLESEASLEELDAVGGGRAVLRAEKQELQRIFHAQIAKRVGRLERDVAHAEHMRDLDRDRVVVDLKDRMSMSDVVYKRLQDTVKGQTDAMERQNDVIGQLKQRLNMLLEDSAFFRGTHETLAAAVDRNKNKELLEDVETKRAEHELTLKLVAKELAAESKSQVGKNVSQKVKDAQKRAKQVISTEQVAAGTSAAAEPPPAPTSFDMPPPPTLILTYTDVEVERRVADACADLEGRIRDELTAQHMANEEHLKNQINTMAEQLEQKVPPVTEKTSREAELEVLVASLQGELLSAGARVTSAEEAMAQGRRRTAKALVRASVAEEAALREREAVQVKKGDSAPDDVADDQNDTSPSGCERPPTDKPPSDLASSDVDDDTEGVTPPAGDLVGPRPSPAEKPAGSRLPRRRILLPSDDDDDAARGDTEPCDTAEDHGAGEPTQHRPATKKNNEPATKAKEASPPAAARPPASEIDADSPHVDLTQAAPVPTQPAPVLSSADDAAGAASPTERILRQEAPPTPGEPSTHTQPRGSRIIAVKVAVSNAEAPYPGLLPPVPQGDVPGDPPLISLEEAATSTTDAPDVGIVDENVQWMAQFAECALPECGQFDLIVHPVSPMDTWSSISQRYHGVPIERMMRANFIDPQSCRCGSEKDAVTGANVEIDYDDAVLRGLAGGIVKVPVEAGTKDMYADVILPIPISVARADPTVGSQPCAALPAAHERQESPSELAAVRKELASISATLATARANQRQELALLAERARDIKSDLCSMKETVTAFTQDIFTDARDALMHRIDAEASQVPHAPPYVPTIPSGEAPLPVPLPLVTATPPVVVSSQQPTSVPRKAGEAKQVAPRATQSFTLTTSRPVSTEVALPTQVDEGTQVTPATTHLNVSQLPQRAQSIQPPQLTLTPVAAEWTADRVAVDAPLLLPSPTPSAAIAAPVPSGHSDSVGVSVLTLVAPASPHREGVPSALTVSTPIRHTEERKKLPRNNWPRGQLDAAEQKVFDQDVLNTSGRISPPRHLRSAPPAAARDTLCVTSTRRERLAPMALLPASRVLLTRETCARIEIASQAIEDVSRVMMNAKAEWSRRFACPSLLTKPRSGPVVMQGGPLASDAEVVSQQDANQAVVSVFVKPLAPPRGLSLRQQEHHEMIEAVKARKLEDERRKQTAAEARAIALEQRAMYAVRLKRMLRARVEELRKPTTSTEKQLPAAVTEEASRPAVLAPQNPPTPTWVPEQAVATRRVFLNPDRLLPSVAAAPNMVLALQHVHDAERRINAARHASPPHSALTGPNVHLLAPVSPQVAGRSLRRL